LNFYRAHNFPPSSKSRDIETRTNINNSSAVAEMGDRGHNRHGP